MAVCLSHVVSRYLIKIKRIQQKHIQFHVVYMCVQSNVFIYANFGM